MKVRDLGNNCWYYSHETNGMVYVVDNVMPASTEFCGLLTYMTCPDEVKASVYGVEDEVELELLGEE